MFCEKRTKEKRERSDEVNNSNNGEGRFWRPRTTEISNMVTTFYAFIFASCVLPVHGFVPRLNVGLFNNRISTGIRSDMGNDG